MRALSLRDSGTPLNRRSIVACAWLCSLHQKLYKSSFLGVAKRVGKIIGGMKCPNCGQSTHQHKIGKTKAGSQRLRCYACGCSYTPEKKVQGYGKAFRKRAIKMYIDGSGFRRTGRQLGIHHQTVSNWAKEEAEQLPKTPMPNEVKTAEFDEIFTYIGDKKTGST